MPSPVTPAPSVAVPVRDEDPLPAAAGQGKVAAYAEDLPLDALFMVGWELLMASTPGAQPEVVAFRLTAAVVWAGLAAAVFKHRLAGEKPERLHVALGILGWLLVYALALFTHGIIYGCPRAAGGLFSGSDCASLARHELPSHTVLLMTAGLMAVQLALGSHPTIATDNRLRRAGRVGDVPARPARPGVGGGALERQRSGALGSLTNPGLDRYGSRTGGRARKRSARPLDTGCSH